MTSPARVGPGQRLRRGTLDHDLVTLKPGRGLAKPCSVWCCQPVDQVAAVRRDLVFALHAMKRRNQLFTVVLDQAMPLQHLQGSPDRSFQTRIGCDDAPLIPAPGSLRVVSGVHLSRYRVNKVPRPTAHDLQDVDVERVQVSQHPDERDLVVGSGAVVVQGVGQCPPLRTGNWNALRDELPGY
jgi:hypothetical protein